MLKTKRNDHVGTPDSFYKSLDDIFHFDYDPCKLNATTNELTDDFPWGKMNFINPPFSNVAPFLEKAKYIFQKYGQESVLLIPVRTNTVYWDTSVYNDATAIWFLKGNIKFKGYKHEFPNALCLVLFTKNQPDKTIPRVAVWQKPGNKEHCKKRKIEDV